MIRISSQDITAAPASAQTSSPTWPGGNCGKGRLIVAICQFPTTRSNVTVKGGTGFAEAAFQDDFSSNTLIGAVKVSDGTEPGITFTHGATAGQMRMFGFQYEFPLAPVSVDKIGSTADDGVQHTSITVTCGGATVQPDQLVISCASLLGAGTSPGSSNGTIIGNSAGGLIVAERIVKATGTFSDVISWTGSIFCTGIIFTVKASINGELGCGFSSV